MGIFRSKNRRRKNVRKSLKQKKISGYDLHKSGSKSIRRRIEKVLDIRYKLFRLPVFRLAFILLFFSIFISSIIWVIRTGYFQISEISVEGVDHITEAQVLNIVEEVRTHNVFTISPGKYEDKLVGSYNYIRSAYVEKILPNKITVHIEEYEPTVVWRTINGAYLIDADGYVLERSLAENVSLDSVIQSISALNEGDESGELVEEIVKEDSDVETAGDEKEAEEKITLDPELEKQIDLELMQKEGEIDITMLDFDIYNILPDSFKKYPQIKIWSDEIFEVNEYIDGDLLGNYLLLLNMLSDYSAFRVKEALIFSPKKVLVIFDDDVKIYFNLAKNVSDQINTLEFIWGRLQIDGVAFREIDLRFKRPVIRQ